MVIIDVVTRAGALAGRARRGVRQPAPGWRRLLGGRDLGRGRGVSQDMGMAWRQGLWMSKARLVITAVIIEGRSQGDAARAYGVSQGWVSRLVARYRAEGEAAFEPRSRLPKTSPNAISDHTADLIIGCARTWPGRAWTPGRRPSAGTCNTTTRSRCHRRRSAGT